jgi:hypothetical protein
MYSKIIDILRNEKPICFSGVLFLKPQVQIIQHPFLYFFIYHITKIKKLIDMGVRETRTISKGKLQIIEFWKF